MQTLLHFVQLRSIGSRIAVSVIALMILGVSVSSAGSATRSSASSARCRSRFDLKEAYERVLEQLHARERTGLALAQAIANYPGIAERYRSGDRAWLIENGATLFRRRTRRGIRSLQYPQGAGSSLCSMACAGCIRRRPHEPPSKRRKAISSGLPRWVSSRAATRSECSPSCRFGSVTASSASVMSGRRSASLLVEDLRQASGRRRRVS